MTSVRFEIPGAPVAKGRPRLTARGGMARAFTPAKTARYESTVALAAQAAMSGRPPFDGPLVVDVDVVLAVPESWSAKRRHKAINGQIAPTKRPDLDNIVKAVLDGCNEIAYVDDARIVEQRSGKRYGPAPMVVVLVQQLDGMEAA